MSEKNEISATRSFLVKELGRDVHGDLRYNLLINNRMILISVLYAQAHEYAIKHMKSCDTYEESGMNRAISYTELAQPEKIYADLSAQEMHNWSKDDPKGYFAMLGLRTSAFYDLTERQIQALIKQQYKLFAKKYHEDKGGQGDKMRVLNNARDCLIIPHHRQEYMQGMWT